LIIVTKHTKSVSFNRYIKALQFTSDTLKLTFIGENNMTQSILDVRGIGPATQVTLAKNGFKTIHDLASTTVEILVLIPGFNELKAAQVIAHARELVVGEIPADKPVKDKVKKIKESKDSKKSKKKDKNKTKKDKKKDDDKKKKKSKKKK